MNDSIERGLPGMMLYFDDLSVILPLLTQEQKGNLLDAVYQFGTAKTEYNGDDKALKMAFAVLKNKIARDTGRYNERRKTNRENATRRGRKNEQSQANDSDCDQSPAMAANSSSSSNSNGISISNGISSSLSKGKRENSSSRSSSSIDSVFAAAAAANMILSENNKNEIKGFVDEYGAEAVITAINKADENSTQGNNKRTIAYIRKTLKGMQNDRWEAEYQQKRDAERIAAGLPKVDERGIEDWNDR